jgi:hypothetical protein
MPAATAPPNRWNSPIRHLSFFVVGATPCGRPVFRANQIATNKLALRFSTISNAPFHVIAVLFLLNIQIIHTINTIFDTTY